MAHILTLPIISFVTLGKSLTLGNTSVMRGFSETTCISVGTLHMLVYYLCVVIGETERPERALYLPPYSERQKLPLMTLCVYSRLCGFNFARHSVKWVLVSPYK